MNKGIDALILGAMDHEISAYKDNIVNSRWHGRSVEVVQCGIGKVAASSETMKAILEYQPRNIIFTGVAGALNEELSIGTIGLGIAAVDADVDARAFDPANKLGQLPFQRTSWYLSDRRLAQRVFEYNENGNSVVPVYIATGDTFMGYREKELFNETKRRLLEESLGVKSLVPWVCDMESSAVLQIATSRNIPTAILRVVSDTLKGDASADFNEFMKESVKHYLPVVDHLIKTIN